MLGWMMRMFNKETTKVFSRKTVPVYSFPKGIPKFLFCYILPSLELATFNFLQW